MARNGPFISCERLEEKVSSSWRFSRNSAVRSDLLLEFLRMLLQLAVDLIQFALRALSLRYVASDFGGANNIVLGIANG